MKNKVEPMNGFLFVRPIRETKETGGLELISKIDEQDRFAKGEVVFADANGPLKPGVVVLYDKNNGHGFQINNELLTVLNDFHIVGVL